ncbi:glycoside hydrolase family 3 C-terminal domain-containing protein [Bacteroides sp. 519]|uniref:glycoside hydrolase family 3 C-terminal domain-containing protein n=1 Tax=Bacteroides sp. 519 TaxID=2302937 RepID=UPI0013D29676|nr:glycoside hydrolase family 3 C-terminal domain-containing protein [Bacteroides sp. 519]NDV60598.1 glucan 1,4-alpha-glucosidase [Bacteroides sp. 519]
MKAFKNILLISTTMFIISSCDTPLPYQDTSLSFEERTEDLVSRLTLEEKVNILRYDSEAIERLGIPAHNFWNECLHGVARSGRATVFPQAIGMAAMWDTDEMRTIADVISDEARAKHHEYASRGKRGIYQGLTFWTPNINIFRDPRWGRGMETYGEDPYLSGSLAIPFIQGLQGDDPRYFKVIATAKHFAVHSGPESIRHSFDVWPNEYDLLETYMPHFKRTVEEAKVYSVMCAYQRFRGAPCCGNKYLEELLRKRWGFEGYIVSDCWAIQDFYEEKYHHVVNTAEEAAAMAVKAGTDLNCGVTYRHLPEAVKQGLITEEELDVSVKRIILARMKLGQFDPQEDVPYAKIPFDVVDSEEHQAIALDVARKSMVLLKNDNNLLPFSKDVKKVAVIGPNADDLEVLLGNYNGFPANPKTPLTALKEKLPNAEVTFAQGCELAANLPYFSAIPTEYLYTDETLSVHGLKATYIDPRKKNGNSKHNQIDANVDFTWGTTAPFKDMAYDNFIVNWNGVLVPPVSGNYAIGVEGYTGIKIFWNDSLLIKHYSEHGPAKKYEWMDLEAGKAYPIRIEYTQENTEHAIARLLWDTPKPDLKKEAIELANSSDLVILCMGLSPLLEGEEMPVKVDGFEGGDRLDIKLPDTQTNLIKDIQKLGKPTVLVLLNGSALAFNWEAEHVPAIIEAWYPGQAGGTAIADILFGDYNPAGRLPLTFYKDIKQIPAFAEYDMAGKTYRYFTGEPLYEFGYGLSYTTFKYEINKIPETAKTSDNIQLAVNVTNTGTMDGDEVVQLYVSLPDSKLKKPIRSLQGFQRIHLKAGETQTVTFTLKPEQIAARDKDCFAVVEEGKVRISIGGKQPDAKAVELGQVVTRDIKLTGNMYYVKE